ncbi:DNA repair protein RAD50 [Carpediemonas membranifera]|uniref:DNA repair protein RAD50 n=1 Tax=Carpediemonas membranifera TaxID=201153 RepID=A0A8J6AWG7_9EUKA|nr:DNA repair protein RAD50 [Carpediemonas membranifera]|eukprot:KAG9390018.1 DNA repair protein RAD50 [Carpediemonas membranifera]
MSLLHSLKLSGVRAFSPTNEQSIVFDHPLTVILGPNGTGKTTIIESIKYAITGSLPPNSDNGKAFVHDFRLDSRTETNAKVDLEIYSKDKPAYRIIRRFKVHLKGRAKTPSFETMDCVLHDATGSKLVKVQMKQKESEVVVPHRVLGVSAAIADNVIFCHQEDSYWPLEADSKVKDRFNDIFSASRYQDALKRFDEANKTLTERQKTLKAQLAHLDDAVAELDRKKGRMEAITGEIAAMEQTLNSAKAELSAAQSEMHAAQASANASHAQRSAVAQLEASIGFKQRERAQAEESRGAPFEESSDKLEEFIANAPRTLERLGARQSRAREDQARAEELLGELKAQRAAADADARAATAALEAATPLLDQASQYGGRAGLERTVEDLAAALAEAADSDAVVSREQRALVAEAASRLSEARSAVDAANTDYRSASARAERLRDRLGRAEAELERLPIDDDGVNVGELDGAMEEAKTALDAAEGEEARSRTALSEAKEMLDNARRRADAQDAFHAACAARDAVEVPAAVPEAELTELKALSSTAAARVSELAGDARAAGAALAKAAAAAKAAKVRLDDFPDLALDQAEPLSKADGLEAKLMLDSAMRDAAEVYASAIDADCVCPVCASRVADPAAVSARLRATERMTQAELHAAKAEVRQLRDYAEARAQAAAAEEDFATATTAAASLESTLEAARADAEQAQARLDEVTGRHRAHAQAAERRAGREEAVERARVALDSMPYAPGAVQATKAHADALARACTASKALAVAKKRVAELDEQRSALYAQVAAHQRAHKAKHKLVGEIEALAEQIAAAETAAETAAVRLEQAQKAVPSRTEAHAVALEDQAEALRRSGDALARAKEALAGPQRLLDRLTGVADHDTLQAAVAEAEGRRNDADRQIQETAETITALRTRLDAIRGNMADTDGAMRRAQCDLRARELEQEIAQARAELDELRAQLGPDRAGVDMTALSSRVDELSRTVGMLQGRLVEIRQEQGRLTDDLTNGPLHRAEGEHRRVTLDLWMQKMAAADVKQFRETLALTLTQFHQDRIAQVNLHLASLWAMAYKGHDIAAIGLETSTAASGRSSYHVTMTVGGHVLPMRGRCSAGQKVLACIIVRLALATAFSDSCGVLVLDEPTTHLDNRNAEAVAEGLRNLIKQSSRSRTFQLVLITHDKSFTDRLSDGLDAARVWRVGKGSDGCSTLTSVL